MGDDLAHNIIAKLQSATLVDLEALLDASVVADWSSKLQLLDPLLAHGTSILHEVLKRRPSERLLDLLSRVLDPRVYASGDSLGRLPLHQAILFQNALPVIHAVAVKNPSAIDQMDRVGETPIDILLRHLERMDPVGAINFVDVLLNIFPQAIHSTNREGENILHRALRSRVLSLRSLDTLIKRKPSLVLGHDASGRTPIHIACWTDFGRAPELVAVILDGCPEPVEHILSLRDALGSSPLHWAANIGDNQRLIETLVRAYPDALQLKNDEGDTPLQSFYKSNRRFFDKGTVPAVARRLMSTVSALLATKPVAALRATKHSAQPVLHASLIEQECPIEIIHFLVLQICCRDQIRMTDGNGNLPLHLACNRPPSNVRSYRDARSRLQPGLMHYRFVINELIMMYPGAALKRNNEHLLPLTLMHRAGHNWNEMQLVLAKYPSAVLDLELSAFAFTRFLCRLSQSDTNTLFQLIQGSPFLFLR